MSIIETIITTGMSSSLCAFIFGEIYKRYVKLEFDKDFADYKSHLDSITEKLKSDLVKEVEVFKIDTSHLSNRGVKSNENEYLGIVQSWGYLISAYEKAKKIGSTFYQTYLSATPSEDDIENVSVLFELSSAERKSLSISDNKSKALTNILRSRDFKKVTESSDNYRESINKYSIFMDADIQKKFEDLSVIIDNSIFSAEFLWRNPINPDIVKYTNMMLLPSQPETSQKVDELKEEIRKALYVTPNKNIS